MLGFVCNIKSLQWIYSGFKIIESDIHHILLSNYYRHACLCARPKKPDVSEPLIPKAY